MRLWSWPDAQTCTGKGGDQASANDRTLDSPARYICKTWPTVAATDRTCVKMMGSHAARVGSVHPWGLLHDRKFPHHPPGLFDSEHSDRSRRTGPQAGVVPLH